MATNNTDFVTAEGLAKAMSAVGGGISIEEIAVDNNGVDIVTGVDDYRFLLVFFYSYAGSWFTEVSFISVEQIKADNYMGMCNDGNGSPYMNAYYELGNIQFDGLGSQARVVAVFGIR